MKNKETIKPTLKEDIEDMTAFFNANLNDTPQIDRLNALPPQEKRMLLTFLHYGNYVKTAKHYRCSANWIGKRIRKILNDIK